MRRADELIETDGGAIPQEGSVADQSAPSYDTLYDRAETIRALILDGSLDPFDGVFLWVCGSERVVELERQRREAEGRQQRHRYSEDVKEQALALVAGGASYRQAAAATLGHMRHGYMVFRWAKAAGVERPVRK